MSTPHERLVVLIACEKLEIGEAYGWTIERVASHYLYRVAIPNQPIVDVTDAEIHERRPQ